ncbi:MAG: hypothetical protein M3145_01065 [Pseudomonadota bacterium]|nr:hypothetical protein [Pseudomonadota bacterium]
MAVAPGIVDLSTCEREPIHIPGSIQPHGVLLVLKPAGLEILQASAKPTRCCGAMPPAPWATRSARPWQRVGRL